MIQKSIINPDTPSSSTVAEEEARRAVLKTHLNPDDYLIIYRGRHREWDTNKVACDSSLLIDLYTDTFTDTKNLKNKLEEDDSPKKFMEIASYPQLKDTGKYSFISLIKEYENQQGNIFFGGNRCLNTICNEIDTAISNYCKNIKSLNKDKNFINTVKDHGNSIKYMNGFSRNESDKHRKAYGKYNLNNSDNDNVLNNLLKSVIITNKLTKRYNIDKYYSNEYLIVRRIKLIISIDMLCIFHSYKKPEKNKKQVQKLIDLKKKYLGLIDKYIYDPESLCTAVRRFSWTYGGKKLTKPKIKKPSKPKVIKTTKPKVKKPSKPKVKKPTKK